MLMSAINVNATLNAVMVFDFSSRFECKTEKTTTWVELVAGTGKFKTCNIACLNRSRRTTGNNSERESELIASMRCTIKVLGSTRDGHRNCNYRH